ncbi:MAG: LysR family transcriptional regulator [Alphaproteobacteria bacterium]|nr:LysR family transcriptional regulator [Alphaproteobacteria bacterium]
MDIQDLRIFDRVAALQNLSAVGNEFSLTPGTISKRLQSLEDEIGARFFTRSTRSIRITEEGRIFLEHAQRMLSEFDAAKASVDGNRGSPRGLIRMSVPPRIGNRDIAAGLSAFMAAYPEIDVHAEVCDRASGAGEDGFDITIKTGALLDSSLIAKRLADDPMIIVASPDYLKLNGTPTTPQDLERHSCLVHADICHWPFRRKSADRSVRVGGRMRSNDIGLLRRAARDGLGLVRVSAALVDDDVKAGYLVPVLTEFDTSGDSAVWAIFPRTKHMLPRLRAFLDFLSDWLKEPGQQNGKIDLGRPATDSADAFFATSQGAGDGSPSRRRTGIEPASTGQRSKSTLRPRKGRPRSGATA